MIHVVSKVNWSCFGLVWRRPEAVWRRVFAIFCHFWQFLPFFWPIFGKVPAGEPWIYVEEGRNEVRWCVNGLMMFLKSIGVCLDGLEATRGGLEAIFSDFLSFLVIFGHFFLAFLGLVWAFWRPFPAI